MPSRIGATPTVIPVASRLLAPCLLNHPHIRYDVHSLSSEANHRQLDIGFVTTSTVHG
ncbi:hypothetical protein PPMP20_22705 [Paraburkholderia phymatum]|uniref:hypothetical protein n=1 Tax=Paraburkholderia phymatum TaxID=148447 RepID=UPI0002E0102D|nr:hypothetical protein [Paraburkholderia phymatum]